MSFDLKLDRGSLSIKNGAPELVRNKDKLIQDVLKLLFTATGENKTHPWYGTPILSKAIGMIAAPDLLQMEIQSGINYGLNNLKTLQTMQSQDNQFTTPQELLANVLDVSVDYSPSDRRKLIVNIKIQAKSNQILSESFIVGT